MKPNRKLKKAVPPPKLKLERVVGLSTKNANGLVSNGSTSNCVYVAGCVVVVYNVESGTQSHLMVPNRTPKPLYCVAMSNDGRFIAAGESGPQSALLVWDSASFAFLSELKSHQHGVECVAFSPNGKHLVSVGFPHDGFICLWDWRSGMLITKLKAVPSCSSVVSICFSSDAKFIVTAGKKHLKFWKIISSPRPRGTRAKCLTMHGKPINLGNQKGCSFIAVTSPVLADSDLVNCDQACETLPMYALTDAGLLCIIHSGLSIGNSVDIKVRKAFAMSASSKLIACACNNGVIKLFTLESLKYSGSLCYDEVTQHKKADGINRHIESSKRDLQLLPTLPHAIACQFSNSEKLVVVYGDHSLYVWEIHDLDKATSCHVLVSHCACIGNIKYLPCENKHDAALACVDRGCFGDLSLSTCSEDGIIGLWDHAQAVSPVNDPTLATSHNFGMKPVKSMSVMFRDAAITGTDCKISRCNPQMASCRTVDERTTDPTMNVVVTVGQDKKINISSIASGKLIRSFKQGGDFGDPIKVIVDPSSSLLVCAYSNMSIYIYDFFTGGIVARAVGHGEVITDMSFSTECKHIVSVDGDGCNFIWKVPTSLSSKMLHKIMENPRPLSLTSTVQPVALNQMKFNEVDHQSKINSKEVTQSESTTPVIHRLSAQRGCLQEISVFKFSISRLPKWAQAKITSPQITPLDSDYSTSQKIGNFLSVCSHGCVDVQTPSKDEQEGCEPFLGSFSRFSSDTSDTDTSLGSRLSLITHRRSFSLDRRWLTIHNVCLDLLTSPCLWDNEDKKVMVNVPSM